MHFVLSEVLLNDFKLFFISEVFYYKLSDLSQSDTLQKLTQYLVLIYELRYKYFRLIITQLALFSMKWIDSPSAYTYT